MEGLRAQATDAHLEATRDPARPGGSPTSRSPAIRGTDGSCPPAVDVYALRLRLGLSQHALGDLIGVTTDTVRFWEYGRRRPSRMATRALQNLEQGQGVTRPRIAISAKCARIAGVSESSEILDVEAAARRRLG